MKRRVLGCVFFVMDVIRPFLGMQDVCIYPLSCRHYAKAALENKAWYIAIPLIIGRILSCNPITGLIRIVRAR